jgi:hypothetical protein
MKEEVMLQILILCVCAHSSGHTQDHNGRSQQGEVHGSTLQQYRGFSPRNPRGFSRSGGAPEFGL